MQRGLFWATTYRTHSEEEKKQGYNAEKIGIPPLNKRRGDANYGLLNHTPDKKVIINGAQDKNFTYGIVRHRHPIWYDENGKKQGGNAVYVQKGDVIIGKVAVQSDKSGKEELTDCSVVIKKGEEGYIDRIFTSITPNGYKLVKIVIRRLRVPEVGDKFASRSAQKGTLGAVYNQEDMPWTQEGIVPDIIINPHCLSGDTIIQLSNGEVSYIRDIYDKDLEIATIDPDTLQMSCTKYTDGFVKQPAKMIQLTTTSGRILKCTPEHLWLVSRTNKICWVQAKDISLYSDKVIVTHSIVPVDDQDDPFRDLIIESGENRYWKRIQEIGLTGIIPTSKALILARLLGAVDSDGHLLVRNTETGAVRCFLHVGEKADYMEICMDVGILGFKKPIMSRQEHCYRVELEVALGVLLQHLGACVGNKTKQVRVFPDWLLTMPRSVKREFLSGYHGGDGSKISVNVKNIQQQVRVRGTRCRTRNNVKDSHIKYLRQMMGMLSEFGIESTLQIYATKYDDRTDLMIAYSNKQTNISLVADILAYRYCNHKRRESVMAIEYLRSHMNGFKMNYEHFSKCFQIHEYAGSFICNIGEINVEPVYDFTTVASTHSFIANGVISHNCMPSRMTINQMMESVLGKSCALEGKYGDATPFTSSSVDVAEKLCDRLGMNQYERCGNEQLYNGMTGLSMGSFFIGPVYYQRLKHLVSDKIHARATGPVTTLTRQPLEGRSRDGGLRFGEMERDCMIGHGTAKFLQERLYEQSDKYDITICDKCGNFATSKTECRACETDQVSRVKCPYTTKLLLQELAAMLIKTKIVAKV